MREFRPLPASGARGPERWHRVRVEGSKEPSMTFFDSTLSRIVLATSLPALAASPCAAGYPDRSVRIVVPFAAGGIADITARIVAEKLGDKLGHRLVVDNQPGAGGIKAANQMRSARPDGSTLALLSNGTAISVGLFKRLPYDPVKDFAPISSMGYF